METEILIFNPSGTLAKIMYAVGDAAAVCRALAKIERMGYSWNSRCRYHGDW